MKTVAVVPMKLNNQRLPKKNTKSFTNGKPLCYYILETLKKVGEIDEIYVYCSNPDIKQFIPDGVNYLARSEELDKDSTKMNEVLKAFARDVPADVYVMTHTTAPFVSADSIEKGVKAVLGGEYDSAFAVKKIQDFLWKDNSPFNYSLNNIPRTQDLPPMFEETSGFYIYKSEVITKLNRRIGDNPYIIEVSEIESVDIDEAEDFDIADAIYNHIIRKGQADSPIEKFRKAILSGKYVYGPFMKTADPMFVEAVGLAGFDFVILDMEHGPVSFERQQDNIRAAALHGMIPIIRVPNIDENTIGTALDIGAMGVQVPQVKNAEQARKVAESARFYPNGMRGVCRFVRAAQYSKTERNEYFAKSKELLVIIQLEGVEAIENLDEILDVEGIDILFVGPYDLSQSLGVTGDVENEIVINKMKSIIGQAKKKGKTVGTFVDNIKMLNLWREAGVQYLSYSVDIGIFTDACNGLMRAINKEEKLTQNIGGGTRQVVFAVFCTHLFMQSIRRWHK